MGSLSQDFPAGWLFCLSPVLLSPILSPQERNRLVTSAQLCMSFFIFGIVFSLGGRFLTITNYPFSLTWSEGNRFWDYSILFGRNLYNFPYDQPIFAFIDKGRQSLWGLPFLFGPVSIMQLRLWNVILNTVPYILFGWIVFQRFPDNNRLWILSGFWTYLFLRKGPIYTPFNFIRDPGGACMEETMVDCASIYRPSRILRSSNAFYLDVCPSDVGWHGLFIR